MLFNTHGQFFNQIWPSLSEGDRSTYEMTKAINQIASKLNELRENDILGEEPIHKVKSFMKEVFGQEMIENDMIDSINESEHNVSFQSHIF